MAEIYALGSGHLFKCIDGQWMQREDYDALAARLAEAERKYEERVRQHEEYIVFAVEEITGLIEAKRKAQARLASADIEATSLLMAMVQQWPDVHPDWQPLPDVAGKITQINNMVAGLRARLAEAEAWLRSADLSLRDKDRALAIRIQHFLRPADSASEQESGVTHD